MRRNSSPRSAQSIVTCLISSSVQKGHCKRGGQRKANGTTCLNDKEGVMGYRMSESRQVEGSETEALSIQLFADAAGAAVASAPQKQTLF